ncbi:MAG: carbon monoxide dehydrogenase [Hydrocarboniphaga sp.]|uniref:SRPBCC family protein n=1 Tax=Hydrocarboniphaga sp. TaxID=2033016 RepID=UPI0026099628|nr:carbon monoxide dehydrogenase subunit G [Hydrocarboniphaga sp.]MDB5967989.1 carbon monoxide dehydrogenase [Hydrocarboniphaga sp.]
MQMTGQQRISATRQQVWDGLYDPDVLKRCIPGCQTVTKESEERMRAAAEIKIGPIGARFNGTVTLSDIDPLNSYTLTIEAQGGTVGFVKSIAKVRLTEDNGATLLAYEVDAQIGGRLAQLGGAIMDATAKQMANRFFQQFGSIVGKPAQAAAAQTAAGAAVAAGPSYAAPASRGTPVTWMLTLVVAALVGYLVGHAKGGGDSEWMGLAIGFLVVIVAAAGFEFGRRAAAPLVTLDASLLARLLDEAKR